MFARRARCSGTCSSGSKAAIPKKRGCSVTLKSGPNPPIRTCRHDHSVRGRNAVCRFRPEPNVETLCKGNKCLEELLTGAVVRDDLEELIPALPEDIRQPLLDHPDRTQLLEVVLDLGRRPEARFQGKPGGEYLREAEITAEDLLLAERAVGEFGADNRAGVAGTLHRISAMRSRKGGIVGLTCRVGRAVTGHTDMLRDLVESGQSVLLLGRPGVGKTTVIREIARVLADELRKRVVIVDTSNEIGGDSDVPHAAIGGARRMQVADADKQHLIMVEAVENHMPQVIIVDEIGTEAEALACRSIAERGVQLIGTAHGQLLENLIKNVTLSDLIGGVHSVTLGDEQAKLRGTKKSILERKAPPTFPIVVEIRERSLFVAHWTQDSVDSLLVGKVPMVQVRERDAVSCQVNVTEIKYSEVPEPSGGVRKPIATSPYDIDYEAALAQAHGGRAEEQAEVDAIPSADTYNDMEIMKLVERTTLFARSSASSFLTRAPTANGAAGPHPQLKGKKAKASARRALRAMK